MARDISTTRFPARAIYEQLLPEVCAALDPTRTYWRGSPYGGSDANELNGRGVRACVLGIGAENCHSVSERMSLSQLELLTRWVLQIVRR